MDFKFQNMSEEDKACIPIYLTNFYEICWVEILGERYVYAKLIDLEIKVNFMVKHKDTIINIFSTECIFEIPKITSYQRNKLIELKLSFIVPDSQVFLAYLSINLTNKVNKDIESQDVGLFSTSYQILFLNLLYNEKFKKINPTEAARILGFTKMTMARAFQEMEDLELVSSQKIGNKKIYTRLSDDRELIKKAFEHLKDPVAYRVYTNDLEILEKAPMSGLQALSEISMINPPTHDVRALKKDDKRIKDLSVFGKEYLLEKDFFELEIWNYDPCIFEKDRVVDLISLIASLKHINDDRIQIEISHLIGEYSG